VSTPITAAATAAPSAATTAPGTGAATSATGSSTAGGGTSSSAVSAQENLFLKLMVSQLQNQDPLSPTDTSNYLSQLAQFTSLEQETNTANATQTLTTQSASSEALSLLGRTVSYTDPSGAPQHGQVTAINLSGASPTLTVGSTAGIAPSAVTGVS
jgi:flagellar basal-body rod modification protein FlgD